MKTLEVRGGRFDGLTLSLAETCTRITVPVETGEWGETVPKFDSVAFDVVGDHLEEVQ